MTLTRRLKRFVVVLALLCSGVANAQFGGGGFGGGGQGGGGQGGGGQGGGGFGGGQGGQGGQGQGGFQAAGGIVIDGDGVLSAPKAKVIAPDVAKKRMQELAKEYLSEDVQRSSALRKVSLKRLEKVCADIVEKKSAIPADVQYLAGLQRIDFIFVFPETNDLVIAGPAEPFAPDSTGRAIGLSSGRPALRLDDFLVALRTAQKTSQWGCSIDPVPERLTELQQYIQKNVKPGSQGQAQQRFHQMQKILGNHEVKVWGVPNDTHFAHVLVEADFHMKLIAIDLEQPPVSGLKSHLDLIQPGSNSMQRWWFMPLYEAFRGSGDGLAFQFSGQRCQLMSQEEFVDAKGKRSDAAFTQLATQAFGKGFTEKFPELAKKMPVFAELQNLFDMAVLVALMKREQLPQKANWQPNLFLDEQRAPVLRGPVPKHTKTLLNMKTTRGVAIGLLSGGVLIDSQQIVDKTGTTTENAGQVASRRQQSSPPTEIDAERWWWD